MTEEPHRKYAGMRLLSELERRIAALPTGQQRKWKKKWSTLQRQAIALMEIPSLAGAPWLPPEQRLPQRMTSAECALCRAHFRERRALTRLLRKRSAPLWAWTESIPPSGIWATLALGKLRRAIVEIEKQITLQTLRSKQIERQGAKIWQAFSQTPAAGDASPAKMIHIFVELQERKQRLEYQQAELFIKKYEAAPLSALFEELEHRLDLWEAETAQPHEYERLHAEAKQERRELAQWTMSIVLCRERLATLRQMGFSETQQALLYWIPHYLEKLETLHAIDQQTSALRMGIQLVRLHTATQIPTKKKESTSVRLKACLCLWEQKCQRVQEGFLRLAHEARRLEQGRFLQDIIRANGEALASLPFLLDEPGRKTLYLWLQARRLSLGVGMNQETMLASPPLRICQKNE